MFYKFIHSILFFALISLVGIVSSCSQDDSLNIDPIEFPEDALTDDILAGKLVYYFDMNDSLTEQRIKLFSEHKVEIKAAIENSPYKIEHVVDDGNSYLQVTDVDKNNKSPFSIIPVTITPKNNPDDARNIILVFRKKDDSSDSIHNRARNADNPLKSSYSEYMGKSTRCYKQIGNTVQEVLLYKNLSKLDGNYLNVTSTVNKAKMYEISGDSYQSTMQQWAFRLGASFSLNTHHKAGQLSATDDGTIAATRLNGTFNFGMEGTVNTSESYEYYMNIFFVNKAEISLNMSRFERSNSSLKPDSTLLYIVSHRMVNEAIKVSTPEEANKFYDDWGTDVITQGVFGGSYVWMYGRKENIYETSVGFDANVEMRRTRPAITNFTQWWQIYLANSGQYGGGEGNINYNKDEYSKASKSVTGSVMTGGNMNASSNPQAWIDGFNDYNQSDKWSIIGYRRQSEQEGVNDSTSLLYPIEKVALDVLDIYYSYLGNKMTRRDKIAFNKAADNIEILANAKKAYLEKHTTVVNQYKPRLVIADLLVEEGTNNHKKGEPKPFVRENPRKSGEMLMYYPMMANKFAPCDNGYAIETSQDDYEVTADNCDQYWYYALSTEDDCDGGAGIVDVKFDKTNSDLSNQYYVRRGMDNRVGGDAGNIHRCMWVKYYDPKIHKAEQKITAFGLFDEKSQKIIASTGGSELKRNSVESEDIAWNNYWSNNTTYETTWMENGNVHPHPLKVTFTTKTLPIERINENTICQPYKWGE